MFSLLPFDLIFIFSYHTLLPLSVIHTVSHCVNNMKFCNNFDEERRGLNLFPEKEMVSQRDVLCLKKHPYTKQQGLNQHKHLEIKVQCACVYTSNKTIKISILGVEMGERLRRGSADLVANG